ncbi:NEPrilysin metallopeptidase family [Caenorhabditis elegans]|uniref:NEPrilysin metallopeptidase family n=1 Tax=Caenorhabditis elegans TaxID=6239 RepID=Q9U2T1_CAEEL|nr:NEPrilysin metallopeptidase family [Caenorhabditis elegans]CAB55146.2 NEPrilysin metallopeptidase family [Caenorhabditis elegans]|eukprot:NP_503004.2 NEPrilysin metallopeptidase family [Caenorhabditis elegans]
MNLKKVKEKLSCLSTNILLLIVVIAIFGTVVIWKIDKLELWEAEALSSQESMLGELKVAVTSLEQHRPGHLKKNVCQTPECITLAHQLHNYHDPSADPCDNFYQSVCGKQHEHSLKSGLAKKHLILRNLIRETITNRKVTPTSKSENEMRKFHGICSKYQRANSSSDIAQQALRDIFRDVQSIGSWPAGSRNWNESDFNLNEMLNNLVKLGQRNFGLFQISFKYRDQLLISAEEHRRNYSKLEPTILNIFETNGLVPDRIQLLKDLEGFASLEALLKNHYYLDNMDKMKPAVLDDLVPSVDFMGLVKAMISPGKEHLMPKIELKTSVLNQTLFNDENMNLEAIILDTPKRTLANYLIFNFIDSSLDHLVFETTSQKGNTCEDKVITYLPRASLRVFIRNYVDKENRDLITQLAEKTRIALHTLVQNSTWLKAESKQLALDKINAMGKMIGYPDFFEPPGTLDGMFKNLNLDSSDTYYTALNKLERYFVEQKMDYFAEETPLDPDLRVFEMNAYYYIPGNQLNFLAPFFDDPMFDSTYPDYVNIAMSGNIIGHEMGHAFGPHAILRTVRGREVWMKPEELAEYESRAQCLANQYSEYDDPDFGRVFDGGKVIDELVADNIGREVSWKMFKSLDLTNATRIIGFEDYDIDQLYFRVGALTHCTPHAMRDLKGSIESSHPRKAFRVNGVYANLPEFARAFNCPTGSPMNPRKKCDMF